MGPAGGDLMRWEVEASKKAVYIGVGARASAEVAKCAYGRLP